MKEIIKIKGAEIIRKWENAAAVISKHGYSLGEIGWDIRSNGYDIHRDGFNCGTFSERGIDIWYQYNNFEKPWHIVPVVNIGQKKYDILVGEKKNYLNYIDEEKDYEVEIVLSVAEQFERGLINPTCFRVSRESYKCSSDRMYFKTFEDADKYAQDLCKDLINERFKDYNRDIRWYYETSVKNNAQLAKENYELRHYLYYDYKDHPHWVSVVPY